MAEQVNYYEVLGIPRNSSRDEVRSAYRNLAKERHPDHPSGSAEAFSLLQEAQAVLTDPNRRQQHDQDLDLAYAADQLSGLDFSSLEDEVAAKRQEKESSGGPGFGERLKNRFGRRNEDPDDGGRNSNGGRDERGRNDRGRDRGRDRGGRGQDRYGAGGKWYEPHSLDPEPITFKSGAFSFLGAFAGFILAGQVGLWAEGGADPGIFAGIEVLDPFMFLVYTIVGLLAAYFAFRAAGYWAVALVFVAALVVGGSGGPVGLLQFGTLGIGLLLFVIYMGNRREQTSRSR